MYRNRIKARMGFPKLVIKKIVGFSGKTPSKNNLCELIIRCEIHYTV